MTPIFEEEKVEFTERNEDPLMKAMNLFILIISVTHWLRKEEK